MQKLEIGRESRPQSSFVTNLLLVLLLGFAAYNTGWINTDWFKQQDKQDDQEQVDPIPDDGKKVDGATLVVVLEKRATADDQELILRGIDRLVDSNKIAGKRVLDDDDVPVVDQLRKYAEDRKIDAAGGLVFLIKDKKVLKAAKFPKTEEELERFVK
jgi:hypothetical protein